MFVPDSILLYKTTFSKFHCTHFDQLRQKSSKNEKKKYNSFLEVIIECKTNHETTLGGKTNYDQFFNI